MKPEKRFRSQYALHVTAAPEPTDIKYENLETTRVRRWQRMLQLM